MSILKEGYLYKQGGMIKTWKKRYFLINNATLHYYEDELSARRCDCDGTLAIDMIPIESSRVTLYKTQDVSRPYTLGLQPQSSKRNYLITADSASSLKEWVSVILSAGAVYSSGSPTVNEIETNEGERVSPYSTLEGWLWKQGGRIKTWRLRYFIIENGLLHYYKGIDPDALSQPIRSIPLYDSQVHHLSISESQSHVTALPKGSVLTGVASAIRLIPPPGLQLRSFIFCAHNESIATVWVEKLQRAISGKDREEGEEDMPQEPEPIPIPEPTPKPVPAPEPVAVAPEPAPNPQEPVVPKRPEKPKKVSRELTPENTTVFFQLLDSVFNNVKPDLSVFTVEQLEEINSQLFNIGLSPIQDLVLSTSPVALHPTITSNNQPTLSTPAFTSNLGVTSGWLLRQQENGEWKLRWCVINRGTKALRYWSSPADLRSHAKPLKTVSLLDCKWKTSNDESCPIIPSHDYQGQTNDDVFLIVKPVNAFGSNKTQQSKLQQSQSSEALTADGKKAAAQGKKLIPLGFAAPNNALRDKWLEAIKDASKDLDTEDSLDPTPAADPNPPKRTSITGRLSVFASGLMGGKKEAKVQEPTIEESEDDIDLPPPTSIIHQTPTPTPAPAAAASPERTQRASIFQNSAVGNVRQMPLDTDSSDDEAPPPPMRKPTMQTASPSSQSTSLPAQQQHQPAQPQPQPVQQPQPEPQPEPEPEPVQQQPQPVPQQQQQPQPQPQQQQQQQQPVDDFDENELREQIESDIIQWIKECEIQYLKMLLSLHSLFPQGFNAPTFKELQYVDPEQISTQDLHQCLVQCYNFLNGDNIQNIAASLGFAPLQQLSLTITAEMCAEALESAFEDYLGN